jgi:hypothetical protein
MDESCKDCTFIVDLRRDVDGLKDDVKDMGSRLQEVEKTDATRAQQMINFGEKLDKIDKNVEDIKKSREKFTTGIISGVAITTIAAFVLQALKVFHW